MIKGRHSDVPKLSQMSITPGPHSGFSCQAVARSLSPKPLGRFCSFLACTFIYWSKLRIQKVMTTRSIEELLENFFLLPWQPFGILKF